jgi:hypothetical protein
MRHPFSPRLLPAVATALGLALLLAAGSMAVSHFVHGEPVHRRHTREVASSDTVAFFVVLFGAAGALLAGLGTRALWALKRRRGSRQDE